MNVILRNPTRELAIDGPISVIKLLRRLDLNRESVLVVRNGTLVPGDAVLDDHETIEIRPVVSGGGGVAAFPAFGGLTTPSTGG